MARTYTLPQFNLTCDVWKAELPVFLGQWPVFRPNRSPDLTLACQLYIATRGGLSSTRVAVNPGGQFVGNPGPGVELRLPVGSPVTHPYGPFQAAWFDLVEVPAASGNFYVVYLALDCHEGFVNEYRLACLAPVFRDGSADDWPRWDVARGIGVARGTA